MAFEWDSEKDAVNLAKHKIGFRQAAEVFRGFRLTREDDRRDYGERRFITLGAYDGEILVVVHTLRGEAVRIISAWKASRHDRESYAEARRLHSLRQP